MESDIYQVIAETKFDYELVKETYFEIKCFDCGEPQLHSR